MKGELSENDLKYKAEAYCSSMERLSLIHISEPTRPY